MVTYGSIGLIHIVLVIVANWITHSYFTDCLQAGIRIFGYRYTMLHAKTCTIDGEWSTVGTCNLDRLSLVGNYEINVAVYSAEFAQHMSALFAEDTAERFEPPWSNGRVDCGITK